MKRCHLTDLPKKSRQRSHLSTKTAHLTLDFPRCASTTSVVALSNVFGHHLRSCPVDTNAFLLADKIRHSLQDIVNCSIPSTFIQTLLAGCCPPEPLSK